MMAKKKNPAAVALGRKGGKNIRINLTPAARETIGAVGSSGSSLESDDACAKAGIAKVAAQLK